MTRRSQTPLDGAGFPELALPPETDRRRSALWMNDGLPDFGDDCICWAVGSDFLTSLAEDEAALVGRLGWSLWGFGSAFVTDGGPLGLGGGEDVEDENLELMLVIHDGFLASGGVGGLWSRGLGGVWEAG